MLLFQAHVAYWNFSLAWPGVLACRHRRTCIFGNHFSPPENNLWEPEPPNIFCDVGHNQPITV